MPSTCVTGVKAAADTGAPQQQQQQGQTQITHIKDQ
jgi:hypothetical protein